MHAIDRTTICGHVFWLGAQAGMLLRGGIDLVAWKIVKTVESMASTINEQLKLTPRRTILAIRTRVLTFCGRQIGRSVLLVSTYRKYVEGEEDLPDPWPVPCRCFLPASPT